MSEPYSLTLAEQVPALTCSFAAVYVVRRLRLQAPVSLHEVGEKIAGSQKLRDLSAQAET